MDKSKLFDEATFYPQFEKDLLSVKKEVIIESPFITISRTLFLKPVLEKIVKKGINVYVITRPIEEQSDQMQYQAEKGIDILEEIGVIVKTERGYLHRKLALIDSDIRWEGSLNILSQKNSKEMMRRIIGYSQ